MKRALGRSNTRKGKKGQNWKLGLKNKQVTTLLTSVWLSSSPSYGRHREQTTYQQIRLLHV